MARRYTLSTTVTAQQNDDANVLAFDTQVDLAMLLSQRLQRNVRQGHVFKVHKMSVGLTPAGGDLDTGLSVAGTVRWCPATKHSVKAWQMAFNTWRRQKRLTINAVGQGVRYDDFEVSFGDQYVNSRTSTLYASGMGDTSTEKVCIYGASNEGDDVTLEDIFESAQPQALPSRFPMTNSVVKEPKFDEEFPPAQLHSYGANWSTIVAAGTAEPDSGASYNADPVYFQDNSCLAGLVIAKGYVLAEDVAGAIEDTLTLRLNFTVSLGSPLVKSTKPKRKSTKRKSTTKRTSRRYKKRS